MTISSLVLTDGTTTATLTDGTNYALSQGGWAPQVTRRTTDMLAGSGPYSDVEESITVNVLGGGTLATLIDNLQRLSQLLDQADRFAAGDVTISPVLIQITMTGGTAKECMVLGGSIALPANYAQELVTAASVDGVVIHLRRRGLWLGETDTASSSATSSGTAWSITLDAHSYESPVALSWTIPRADFDSASQYRFGGQAMIVANTAADIIVQEAEGYAGGTFTSVAITNARGGNALRFTPTLANTVYPSAEIADPTGLSVVGQWAVFAQCVVNNAAYVNQIRLVATLQHRQTITLPWTPVQGLASGLPGEPIPLGILVVPVGDPLWRVRLDGISDQAATAVLQIDYLVFVRLSPDAHIVTLDSNLYVTTTFGTSVEERIDHQLLTAISPVAQMGTSTATLRTPIGSQGSLVLMQKGTNLSGVWMAGNATADGSGYAGLYRTVERVDSLYSSTVTAVRRRGYLVPE